MNAVREADAAEVATVADDHGAIRFPTATGETYLVRPQRAAFSGHFTLTAIARFGSR